MWAWQTNGTIQSISSLTESIRCDFRYSYEYCVWWKLNWRLPRVTILSRVFSSLAWNLRRRLTKIPSLTCTERRAQTHLAKMNIYSEWTIDISRSQGDGGHFIRGHFRMQFFEWKCWISMSPKCLPVGPINNKSELVYVAAWRRINRRQAITTWWRHQMRKFSALLAICAGNSPVTGAFPTHKGQWRGSLMFSLICFWINGWVNNREAGDLRRHRTHYDVIVMILNCFFLPPRKLYLFRWAKK